MKKIDPSIIRVGDLVQIVVPEYVVRVGYPLSKAMIVDEMTKDQKSKLHDSIKGIFDISLDEDENGYKIWKRLLNVIAEKILKSRGFGGRQRSIHTAEEKQLEGEIYRVSKRKVVKTGTYCPGGGGYDYYGEYDYNPAYLANEKTHVLYGLYLFNELCTISNDLVFFEKRCLKKVPYE